ncbi:TIGR04141 family sporadically distributed protein, partial [Acinetobacter baumannii]
MKRHSNASGTSHLLTQALVSAYAFLNDNNAVIDHINEVIKTSNNSNQLYNILNFKYENQKKEIVLAIIDKKTNIKKTNSKMLSLLEMISLRENVKQLEYLGFKCYLKFIP